MGFDSIGQIVLVMGQQKVIQDRESPVEGSSRFSLVSYRYSVVL